MRHILPAKRLDEDSTDYKWVTVAEAKNYDLIEGIFEEIKRNMDKIIN